MLAKDPAQRVQSGAKVCELVDALSSRREGGAPAAPVIPASPPRPQPEPSFLGSIGDRESTSRPSAGRRAAKVLFGILAVLVVVLVIVLVQNKGVDPTAGGRFINNGNGTVTDTQTNLMWATRDNGSDITWDDAKRYCKNYSVGGYSDWRMSTLEELQSLYGHRYSSQSDCGKTVHIISLIHFSGYAVWSSDTGDIVETAAWQYNFDKGRSDAKDRRDAWDGRALPVRSR